MRANYWVYSAGLAVVWAMLLVIRLAMLGGEAGGGRIGDAVLLVFAGFALSWIIETLARSVFAPPARWRGSEPLQLSASSRIRNYWTFSVVIGILWLIVLVVAFATAGAAALPVLYVFAGYAICWISGTIARYVYPPPAKWRQARAVG